MESTTEMAIDEYRRINSCLEYENQPSPALYDHLIKCAACQEHFREEYRVSTAITAWLVVYEVHRIYGGPEEGGWWYDAREFLGVAVPFYATVVYEHAEIDQEDWEWTSSHSGWQTWQDDDGCDGYGCAWVPRHVVTSPDGAQEAFRARAEAHLRTMWPLPESRLGRRGRHSMAQNESDYEHRVEVGNPGQEAHRPRPRYS